MVEVVKQNVKKKMMLKLYWNNLFIFPYTYELNFVSMNIKQSMKDFQEFAVILNTVRVARWHYNNSAHCRLGPLHLPVHWQDLHSRSLRMVLYSAHICGLVHLDKIYLKLARSVFDEILNRQTGLESRVGKMCNPHPRWKTRVGILWIAEKYI